jgi:hypothetical protein
VTFARFLASFRGIFVFFQDVLLTLPEPFERTWSEIEFASSLLVASATQTGRVIDAVGARSCQSFLLGDLRWFGRSASTRERGQPYPLLAWVVVYDVVGARRTFERCDRGGGGIIDVDEARNTSPSECDAGAARSVH